VFFEPGRTQFDLSFSLFGIHVRIHPAFWLMSAIMGWSAIDRGIPFLLVWIACVFVSILVHEMGHVLVGLMFGSRGYIVLYSFGGLAIGSRELDNRWQRIAVSFGGPAAGFVLAGLTILASYSNLIPTFDSENVNELIDSAIWDLLWVNLFWGLVNLLPVFPLDGGQISRELWEWSSRRHGFVYCLRLSIAVAVVLVVHSLILRFKIPNYPFTMIPGGLWTAILFGSLAAGNYQALSAHRQMNEHWDDKYDEWEREERDSWKR
jgi:Zn-dependent protease